MHDFDFASQIELAKSGDAAAVNGLFLEFYPRVRSIVHRRLDADIKRGRPWLGALFSTQDVVQDVFISVLRDLTDFVGATEREFTNYLVTVTKNRLLDAVRFHETLRRDRRRMRATLEDDVMSRQEGPADHAVSVEETARYCRAIASFNERERILLSGRIEDERPFDELAEELAYPTAGAARKAYYSAKARLVASLSAAEGGVS